MLPVPLAPLLALAPLTRAVPALPVVRAAELRRLTENKNFDVEPLRTVLGVVPIGLERGLALTFSQP